MSLRTSREGFEGFGLQAKQRPAGCREILFTLNELNLEFFQEYLENLAALGSTRLWFF